MEKWLHHTKRVTRYYVIREKDNQWLISHEPIGLYRQNRQTFFAERAKAYALIARSMPDHIQKLRSESVWIQYEQEGWHIEERHNTPMKRLISAWHYWMNMDNWNREPGKSWYAIGDDTYRTAAMTRKDFQACFMNGGDQHLTSDHRLE